MGGRPGSPGVGEGLDFARARSRIGGLAWKTPVVPLDLPGAPPVAMKLESLQRTGSFKVRGAANKLLALTPGERAGGVVAASSGNHGRAVAEVARRLGVPATVCVPDWVDPSKLRDIRAAAARVVSAGSSYDEAEERATDIAAKQGKPLVHPFDDLDVIEGQGTVGLEIVDQFPGVEEVVVPLSGGGLVAGIGYALKDRGVRIVAVSARRAAVMARSIGYGRPTRFPDERTVASALSGGIGLDNRFTFAACNEVVSSHVTVSERDIESAIRRAFRECRLVVEGGGAVGLAALWSGRYRPRGGAVLMVTGSNIDRLLLGSLLS
ncbi:MAG: pyridoxal-phosphate dependent enzyme [Gemmatimonadota bacterium]|nr:pyridoxal-phosphate dependent enzyme [Gemmatimonadota bacterium]MDE2871347.1 pyridoxal-phosphate dependent enzyme [Gemmatimonadota bacterium]